MDIMKNDKDIIETDYQEIDKAYLKKEHKYKLFLKKVKANFSDSLTEIILENEYNKTHEKFILYQKDAILPLTLYGNRSFNEVTILSKKEIPLYSILKDKAKKYYYVDKCYKTDIEIIFKDKVYLKSGYKLILKDDLEEVNVIKAGKIYFLYKG